jgi:hypothetical protein
MVIPNRITKKISTQCQELAKKILEEETENTRMINLISHCFLFVFLTDKLIEEKSDDEIFHIKNTFLKRLFLNIHNKKNKAYITREVNEFILSLRKERELSNPTLKEYMEYSKTTIGFSLINSVFKTLFQPCKTLSQKDIDFISRNMRKINDAYERQDSKKNYFKLTGTRILDRDEFSKEKASLVVRKIKSANIDNSYKIVLESLVNNIVDGYSKEKLQI